MSTCAISPKSPISTAARSRSRTGATTRPTLYGIRNCDTVKKARAWLDARGVAYDFNDYKRAGIDSARLPAWAAELAGRSC